MLDRGETGGDERDIGIGAFGGGGANLLVRTAGAGIAFACTLRFGTGTVFYDRSLATVGDRRRIRNTRFGRNQFWGGLERSVDVGIVVLLDRSGP